jgi:hypothetical protein
MTSAGDAALRTERRDTFAPQTRTLTAFVVVALAVYALVLWGWFRPGFLHAWRESDTQTIARHLAEPGASILYPRIDWGGAGPGYVEAEFQLYTWLVSRFMIVFGDVEWPGQLVSLLSVTGAAWVAFSGLRRWYGMLPAVAGLFAMLSTRCVIQAATSVQPESLCLFLFTAAWFAFLEYTHSRSRLWLALYAVTGFLAMLVKPTAAQLGIACFAYLLLQPRQELLKKKDVWMAWAFMVGVLAVHMIQARSVYVEYGNTFGVLSGGDSKFPRLEHLLVPRLYLKAAFNSIRWGVGAVGALAVVSAIARRSYSVAVVALLAGVGAWTLIALRYTTFPGGNHYHVLGAVLAAQATAHVLSTLPEVRWRSFAVTFAALVIAVQMANSFGARLVSREHPWDALPVALSAALTKHSRPGDLIVSRSFGVRYDHYWKTVSNFEDPRIFYLSRTRGWPIGFENSNPIELENARAQGARFYVELIERPPMPALDEWLSRHATLLETTTYGGRVFALERAAGTDT